MSVITGNSGKRLKGFFSNKINHLEKISLVDDVQVVTDDKRVGDFFLENFASIARSSGLQVPTELIIPTDNSDSIENAIDEYQNHLRTALKIFIFKLQM